MHRVLSQRSDPGSLEVQFLEQEAADLIILTSVDTDIQTLAEVNQHLPLNFPSFRVANLLNLQHPVAIDAYVDSVLAKAKGILVRLLGGRAYWSYGFEALKQISAQQRSHLIVIPGDDRPDWDLASHSTIGLMEVDRIWRYFVEGGSDNYHQALLATANSVFGASYLVDPPKIMPKVGVYIDTGEADWPAVGILFYRAHVLAKNTAPIDALVSALQARKLRVIGIYTYGLQEPELCELLLDQFQGTINILLNTTSFSLAKLDADAPDLRLWETLDIPVLQVILSSGSEEFWRDSSQGLGARDIGMNVALPEVDGRIITRAIAFKSVRAMDPAMQSPVVATVAIQERVEFVCDLAQSWIRLRCTAPPDRKIALILANYPCRDGRIANGVGLDTPASCVEILKALSEAGYAINALPKDGEELIHWLTMHITNDPISKYNRPVGQHYLAQEYLEYFATLPLSVRSIVQQRWGDPSTNNYSIPGIQLGNVFLGIQPSRGYDQDPALNYHASDLPPTHEYLAYYAWLKKDFKAHAIVHVGKHGNLEWLPGKGLALSAECFPEVVLGPLPHFYPFIVNDPGEGSQAKRRAQAVIIDHLTPPLARAELHGRLIDLERLLDEYFEAEQLDPRRALQLNQQIQKLLEQESLLPILNGSSDIINQLEGYLCELKESQIRDGLHIFGKVPAGPQLINLLAALARYPGSQQPGITQAIARDWGLEVDPLSVDLSQPLPDFVLGKNTKLRIAGDVVEMLEAQAHLWIAQLLQATSFDPAPGIQAQKCLEWIRDSLLPKLQQTPLEMMSLLHGLDGGYVASGPSGAPTRGRVDVLPTGRNFYSVDIRGIPTETAWQVGSKAAEALVARYMQEEGEYPRTLGLSVWGTSTMRTGGDDWAQALALIGAKPIWDGLARRVVDVEILPISVLGRPRVDVTLRISGFFRDAFPNLIALFDRAVQKVALLSESATENPIANRMLADQHHWQSLGLSEVQAQARSRLRIFGSKPGAYGAGLQGLIEAQNWSTDADLAQAYLNWSGYAYTGEGQSQSAPEALELRLQALQIVLHNQDNREHDLLDSDDYYQFQGGMIATVRALTGKDPKAYFGDHSRPSHPKVRSLAEEIDKVYRSRVINPKWIAGVMRHGYKGAFEMAATVDYLFGYGATTRSVAGFMYQGVCQAFLLDLEVRAFVQQFNPWALRDMSERLLEAHQRGLWQDADPEMLAEIEELLLTAEADVERR